MSDTVETKNPMARQWEDFNWVFGAKGRDDLTRAEKTILINPYSETYESVQALMNDPTVLTHHDTYDKVSSSATSKGLAYLANYARQERKLRSVSFGETPGYQAELPASNSSLPKVHDRISAYMASFAEDQRVVQGPYRDLTVPVEDENSIEENERIFGERFSSAQDRRILTRMRETVKRNPKDNMLRRFDSEGLRTRFAAHLEKDTVAAQHGMKAVCQLAAQERDINLTSAIAKITEASTQDQNDLSSTQRQAGKMREFEERFGNKTTGMGGFGRNFQTRFRTYVESDESDPPMFCDKETLTSGLKQERWSYMENIASKRPDLVSEVIDWAYWLGQERMKLTAGGYQGSSVKPSSSDKLGSLNADLKRRRRSSTAPEDKWRSEKRSMGIFESKISHRGFGGGHKDNMLLEEQGSLNDLTDDLLDILTDDALQRHHMILFRMFPEDSDYVHEYDEDLSKRSEMSEIINEITQFWRDDEDDAPYISDVDEDVERSAAESLFRNSYR